MLVPKSVDFLRFLNFSEKGTNFQEVMPLDNAEKILSPVQLIYVALLKNCENSENISDIKKAICFAFIRSMNSCFLNKV